MICAIHAHPYLHRSRTNRALADALRALPGVEVRSLYDLYPDFAHRRRSGARALLRARDSSCGRAALLVRRALAPQLWIEKVLAHGWAYGDGGRPRWQDVPVGARRRGHAARPTRAADARRTHSSVRCLHLADRGVSAAMHWAGPTVASTARTAWTDDASCRTALVPRAPGRLARARTADSWSGIMMLEAMIYLAAAVMCVPIAASVWLGSVLGYLIAGSRSGRGACGS